MNEYLKNAIFAILAIVALSVFIGYLGRMLERDAQSMKDEHHARIHNRCQYCGEPLEEKKK